MRFGHRFSFSVIAACAVGLLAAEVAARDAAPVDINTASVKDLQELPGVGEATAKKIVAGRPYASVDDLAKAGVSKSTITKIRPLVTTGAAAASASQASASSAKASSASKGPSGPIDLNTASLKDLEELPGVGEATAKKIVAGRPYASVDDLAKAGVSKGTIEKLRSSATVSGAGATRPPAAAAPAAATKSSSTPPTKAAGALVDLNTASLKDLEELPGVGEATAKKIVAGRPYASVDDLSKAGISKGTIEKLRSGATVSGAQAARPPAAASPSVPAATPAAAPPAASPAPAAPAASAGSAPTKAAAPAAASSSGAKEKLAPGEKVNINTATKEELMRLPGIGPTKAQAIIDGRPFATPEDIMKVKGIKEGTYGKLKDDIVVR